MDWLEAFICKLAYKGKHTIKTSGESPTFHKGFLRFLLIKDIDMGKAKKYPTDKRPFLQLVTRGGHSVLRIRQATEQGYIDCYPNGVCDLAYPESELRRARVKEGGRIASTITAGEPLYVFLERNL